MVWVRAGAESLTDALTDEDVAAGQEALELVEALGIRGGRKVTSVKEFRAAPGHLRVAGGGGGEPGAVPTFLVVLPGAEQPPDPVEGMAVALRRIAASYPPDSPVRVAAHDALAAWEASR